MNKEHPLTAEESLILVGDLILKTKENIAENSFLFLLWGWLLAAACMSKFLLETFAHTRYSASPFPIIAAVGMVLTIMYYSKKARRIETNSNHFIRHLWTILMFCFPIIVFMSIRYQIDPTSYILMLEGIGTVVSGRILRFKPLLLGGLAFFSAAIFCILIPDEYKYLIHAIAIITGFIVPGYLLKHAKD